MTEERVLLPKGPGRPRRLLFALFLTIVGLGVFYLGFVVLGSAARVITRNESGQAPFLEFLGRIRPGLLRGEGDGRVNILILGMGGVKHPGGTLTDTIEVLSINPIDKTIGLLGLPRDLLVPIYGLDRETTTSRFGLERVKPSFEGKINTAFALAEQQTKGSGPGAAKATVEALLDLPIHYYVALDFAGFTKLVQSIGGVTVNVPKDLVDPLFPDELLKGYEPFSIKAGIHHLDGETALKYVRSRQTTSDFDRAKRQQQILVALKERVLSLGILGNPIKVREISRIAADHLRTDITPLELERLVGLLSDFETNKVIQVVLDTSQAGVLTSQADERGSFLVPKSGDFDEVRTIAHELFRDPYVAREQAKIELVNRSLRKEALTEASAELRRYGYQVVQAQERGESQPRTRIVDFRGDKPFTVAFLKKRLSARVEQGDRESAPKGIDLKIEIGENYAPKGKK